MIRMLVLVCAVMLAGGPAAAVNPDEVLTDPVLEKRARQISKNLRCVVCQNQSIDDSDAELARDLRLLVRERLLQGESDTEVVNFVVNSYGDFVLLKPPMKATTYVLWFGPIFLAGCGILATVVFIRRRAHADVTAKKPAALSDAERKRLNAILNEDETGT